MVNSLLDFLATQQVRTPFTYLLTYIPTYTYFVFSTTQTTFSELEVRQ